MNGFYYWSDNKKKYVAYVRFLGVEVDTFEFEAKDQLEAHLMKNQHILWQPAN